MAGLLDGLGREASVIDLGAGYGGAARYLAGRYGCEVNCLNISEPQNDTNRYLNRRQGLAALVSVRPGVFGDIPEPDPSYDLVRSQDAFLPPPHPPQGPPRG